MSVVPTPVLVFILLGLFHGGPEKLADALGNFWHNISLKFMTVCALGLGLYHFIANRISEGGNVITFVHLSVRLFVFTLSSQPTDR